jgi:hypothetical protein
VDTTYIPFQQIVFSHPTKPWIKIRNTSLFSYKLNGPALCYEIGLSILSNDIVWINGPFLPGDWNDLDIFRQGMLHEIDLGERVKADDIYKTLAPEYVVCPASALNIPEESK